MQNRFKNLSLALALMLTVSLSHAAENVSYPPAEQARIDARRAADMQAERARLQAELKRIPPQRQQVIDALKPYADHYGITQDGYLLCRPNIFVPMFEEGAGIKEDAIANLATFSAELKKRRITDLILLTVPIQPEVYAHRFHKDVGPDALIYPQRPEGMIKLLDAGVEVIDLTHEYQLYDAKAEKEGLPLLYHATDHHWKTPAMQIAAQALAKRLERYPHIMNNRGKPEDFEVTEEKTRSPGSLFAFNGIRDAINKGNKDLMDGVKLPDEERVTQVMYRNASDQVDGIRVQWNKEYREYGLMKDLNMDPNLMIIGDSQVFHMSGDKGGSGFPNLLSYELLQPVMWFGRVGFNEKWGESWARNIAPKKIQPKVLVFTFMTGSLFGDDGKNAWRPVPEFAKVGEFTLEDPSYDQIKKDSVHQAILGALPEKPDPVNDPYKDAFYMMEVTMQTKGMRGRKIAIVTWAMKDRVLNPNIQNWTEDQKLKLRFTRWDDKAAENEGWDQIKQLDAGVSLDLPIFWVEPAK